MRGEGGEFVGCGGIITSYVHVGFGVHGDKMNVSVWDGETFDANADSRNLEFGLEVEGEATGDLPEIIIVFVAEIPQVVYLNLGDDKGVTLGERVNVEEGDDAVVFVDDVSGEFAIDYLGE